jgi:hypothetical protein
MANTLLTAEAVTREALRILHQKLNFIGSINRQYDESFAQAGAKTGDSLKIRLPNQYAVRTGKTLDTQDTTEQSVTLQVATQKGVDVNFSSRDLTLSMDDFAKRVLDPAMSVLAANIEADAISMYKDVYNEVADIGAAIDLIDVLNARKKLQDNLAPTANRSCNLNTQDNVDLVDELKGLFHDSEEVSRQYLEGYIGRTAGFDFMENTLWPSHATGTDDGTGDYLTDIAGGEDDGSAGSLHVDTGTGTLKKGDVITIEDVYRVHPETKASTGALQQFVVTADYAGGEGDLAISPSIVSSGVTQNVNAAAQDGKVITKLGGASASHGISMAYHEDAFTFATADLVMPKGVDFAARLVFDGVSMRIIRDYDINNDNLPCRIDVLYGYKTMRPEFACRLAFN